MMTHMKQEILTATKDSMTRVTRTPPESPVTDATTKEHHGDVAGEGEGQCLYGSMNIRTRTTVCNLRGQDTCTEEDLHTKDTDRRGGVRGRQTGR